MTNPYEPPSAGDEFAPRSQRIKSLANKSLLFGLLGLFCCGPLFGPLAIHYANQAEAAVILDESGAPSRNIYKAGRVLGYLGIVLWVLSLIFRLGGLSSR